MPIFLAFEIGAFADARIRYQGKNHLVRCRAEPYKIGPLRPSRHHGRRRQVTELNFAGEQCLDCRGTTADVNQIGVEAMFFEITFIMAQPKRADARRERAVSGTNGRRSVLCGAVGQIPRQPNRQ